MKNFITNRSSNSNSIKIKPVSIGLIGVIAALAGVLLGFDAGAISGSQEFISQTFNIQPIDIPNSVLKGLIVASVPIGALLGAILSGRWAKIYGGKRCLSYIALIFALGSLITATASALYIVIIGRIIIGFSIGVCAMVAPMYLSEVSPPSTRGRFIFLFQLAIAMATFLALALNYFLLNWIADFKMHWRYTFGIGIIPAIGLFASIKYIPDSPRWLILKNRVSEAHSTLQKLLGKENVDLEFKEMQRSLIPQKGYLKNLLTRPLFPLLILTFGLFALQQLTGINAVVYYGPAIFSKAGFGENGKFIAQIALSLISILATGIGAWIVDKNGRRPLLFAGLIGIIFCLTTLGLLFKGVIQTNINTPLSFVSVILFITCFSISIAGIPYIIMSEVFPLKIRPLGMAFASCSNWFFNFLVSASFDTLQKNFGMGNIFLLYATFTGIGLLLTYFFLPETKDRSLEEIESNLYKGKPLRQLGNSV